MNRRSSQRVRYAWFPDGDCGDGDCPDFGIEHEHRWAAPE